MPGPGFDSYEDERDSLQLALEKERMHKDFIASKEADMKVRVAELEAQLATVQATMTPEQVEPAPAGPMNPDRVINALQRNPQLLFDVAKRLAGARALGPWEKSKFSHQWTRVNHHGKIKTEVTKLASDGWRLRKTDGGYVHKVRDASIAMALSDHLWRKAGWVLLGPNNGARFAWVDQPDYQSCKLRDIDTGAVLASIGKHNERWQWNALQTDTTVDGYTLSLQAALDDVEVALAKYGYTVLHRNVSGLPT